MNRFSSVRITLADAVAVVMALLIVSSILFIVGLWYWQNFTVAGMRLHNKCLREEILSQRQEIERKELDIRQREEEIKARQVLGDAKP